MGSQWATMQPRADNIWTGQDTEEQGDGNRGKLGTA